MLIYGDVHKTRNHNFNMKYQATHLYNTKRKTHTPAAAICSTTYLLTIRTLFILLRHMLLSTLNLSEIPSKFCSPHVCSCRLPKGTDDLFVFPICTHNQILVSYDHGTNNFRQYSHYCHPKTEYINKRWSFLKTSVGVTKLRNLYLFPLVPFPSRLKEYGFPSYIKVVIHTQTWWCHNPTLFPRNEKLKKMHINWQVRRARHLES